MSDDDSSLEEIPWVPIYVGQKDPDSFANREWTSAPGDRFPFDIVLGLKYLSNVYKVVVDVNPELVPAKIDVQIGRGEPNCENDLDAAKAAHYGNKGTLVFKIRERGNNRMEGRSLFADHVGHFVWLVVYKPLPLSKNPQNLVGINRVTILGYPVEKDRPRRAPSKSRTRDRSSSAPRRPNSRASTPTRNGTPTRIGTPQAYGGPEYAVTRHSYEGDGMSTSSGGIAGDPLTSIRTVKRALQEKIDGSEAAGKNVEARVCRRAIQRLEEYEVRIEDLASRRSKALSAGDTPAAERLNLAMSDCRDTAFRAIHVDLLLSRNELRSIGVGSRWVEEEA